MSTKKKENTDAAYVASSHYFLSKIAILDTPVLEENACESIVTRMSNRARGIGRSTLSTPERRGGLGQSKQAGGTRGSQKNSQHHQRKMWLDSLTIPSKKSSNAWPLSARQSGGNRCWRGQPSRSALALIQQQAQRQVPF